PVVDDRPAEESLCPLVHLAGDLGGDVEESAVAGDGELEAPLVVERHRRDLSECVLAVEHPAVGARQERVGDIAQTCLDTRMGTRRGSRALYPLPCQIAGDRAAMES